METPTRSRPGAATLLRVPLLPLIWLERARGRWRLALLAAYAAFAGLIALAVVWATTLDGLPDVGDPFAEMPSAALPEDEDALPLYRQAEAAYRPYSPGRDGDRTMVLDWPETDAHPQFRAWLEENRAALNLWRRAAERPRISGRAPRDVASGADRLSGVYHLFWPAQLETSRLETGGDLAGAWGWHLAALRTTRLLGDHDPLAAAYGLELQMAPEVIGRIGRWAADQRVDARLLRKALDDVRALDDLPGPGTEALRAHYLAAMRTIGHPPESVVDSAWDELVPNEVDTWYLRAPLVGPIRWLLKREPERSRRVARLIFANWRARLERPPDDPGAGIAVQKAIPTESGYYVTLTLYDVAPEAPASARALDLDRLADWFASTLLAKRVLREFEYRIPSYEQALGLRLRRRARLIVALAEQIYFRERHAYPSTPRMLVGSVLSALPDGYDPGPHPSWRRWWRPRPGPRVFSLAGYPGDPWIETMIPIVPPGRSSPED